jgi:uncharacterized membrane protein YhiD involved in acid resistance
VRDIVATALLAPLLTASAYGFAFGYGLVVVALAAVAIFAALLITAARTNREVTRRPGYVIGGPETHVNAAALHTTADRTTQGEVTP